MSRFALFAFTFLSAVTFSCQKSSSPPPNVVIIFTDDQGYSDVGCFGADQYPAVVDTIQQLADDMRHRLGDRLYGIEGTENREPGRLDK